jgi:hypothetical protein
MFEFGVLFCLWRCPLPWFMSCLGVVFRIARIVQTAELLALHCTCAIFLAPGLSGADFNPGEQPGEKFDFEIHFYRGKLSPIFLALHGT